VVKSGHNIALNPKTPQLVLGDEALRYSNSVVKISFVGWCGVSG